MKKNKLVAAICQHFSGMVAGCEDYEDYYSLEIALDIAINKTPNDVDREDIEGWLNPHLDAICEDWESYE